MFHNTSAKSLRVISALSVAVFIMIGYRYISAWTPPTGTAPTNNVSAPINSSNSLQIKDGALGVDTLTLFTDAPRIQFADETLGQRDSWLWYDNSTFSFIPDRNNDGIQANESPFPLQIYASTSATGDYTRFSNQVRSPEYCDENGGNCFDPVVIGSNQGRVLKTTTLTRVGPPTISASEARTYWNNLVTATRAGNPTVLDSSGWTDECTWNNIEAGPTTNTISTSKTMFEALQWCGVYMCRYEPALNAITNGVYVMSETNHCGTGSANCLTGNFTVTCIY